MCLVVSLVGILKLCPTSCSVMLALEIWCFSTKTPPTCISWLSTYGKPQRLATRQLQSLLQRLLPLKKVKVSVAHPCPTLCSRLDCSPSGSSVHGILKTRIIRVGSHSLLQGIFPTQGSNPVCCVAGRFFTI